MMNLIVSNSRIGDRIDGLIDGAVLLGNVISSKYHLTAHHIGEPAPAKFDDWSIGLLEAKDNLARMAKAVEDSILTADLTIISANTCSASLATLPIVASRIPDVKVLWIDAHTDFNIPETTKSGYLGGMVVAAACGLWDSGHGAGLDPNQVAFVGARDIDAAEKKLLSNANANIISPAELDVAAITDFIGNSPVWVHIDWDVLEPGFLPADYEIANGLTPSQIQDILKSIPRGNIKGLELAEFNAHANKAENDAYLETIVNVLEPVLKSHA